MHWLHIFITEWSEYEYLRFTTQRYWVLRQAITYRIYAILFSDQHSSTWDEGHRFCNAVQTQPWNTGAL